MHSNYIFDPYPLSLTMQRLAENLRTRRLEKKLSTKSLAAMSGVPAYDLTNDQTLGKHATTINFKGHPTDEDMIAVGTNTRMSRSRCLQIIDDVKSVLNP